MFLKIMCADFFTLSLANKFHFSNFLYKRPHTIAAILRFDVIAEKVHTIHTYVISRIIYAYPCFPEDDYIIARSI